MDTYYDDFYEPSEAEARLQEIEDILWEAVKQEIKDELERLRSENEKLREYKDKSCENNKKVDQKIRELNAEKEKLERTVRQARIRELLGEYIVTGWVVQRIYTKSRNATNATNTVSLYIILRADKK